MNRLRHRYTSSIAQIFSRQLRDTRDAGQAMIAFVVALTVIIASYGAILAVNTIQHDPLLQKNAVEHYTYRAIEAGSNSFLSIVNGNPDEMNCDSKSTDEGECPVGKYQTWIAVTGTTGGNGVVPEYYYWTDPKFCYTEKCTTTVHTTKPLLYVKETIWGAAGFSGHVSYGKITGDFEAENGFLTHVWWSDFEVSDPILKTTRSTAACTWDWNNDFRGPNVPLPTVTSLSPATGSIAGGTSVTINGVNFVGSAAVTFGGVSASTVYVVSSTEITVKSPPHAAGIVTVVVTTVNGASAGVTYTYKTLPPTLTKVTPDAGPTGGGTTVTLTGSGFLSGSIVEFGTTPATTVTVVSGTEITAKTPAHATGTASVTVTTASRTSAGITYTYDAVPTLKTITKSYGSTAGGTTVTLNGTGFISDGTTVTFGGTEIPTTEVTYVSTSKITVTAPSSGSAKVVSVTVTTPGGTSNVKQYTYYAKPTLISVTPAATKTKTATTTVTLTGTGFVSGGTTVTFGGTEIPTTEVTYVSSTEIKVTAPKKTAVETTTVTVTTLGGTSAAVKFYYGVKLTGVTNSAGPTAGGNTVTLTGTGFVSGGTTVTFGGTEIPTTEVTYVSSTEIKVTAPAHAAGTIDVTVTTAGGTSGDKTYSYDPSPTLTSLTPASGQRSNNTAVTLTGTGFVTGATVKFGTETGTTVTVVSSTEITVDTPKLKGENNVTVKVTVTTPGGTSNSLTFEYTGTYEAAMIIPAGRSAGSTRVVQVTRPRPVIIGSVLAGPSTKGTAAQPKHVSLDSILSELETPTATLTSIVNSKACTVVIFAKTTQVYGPIFSNDSLYVETDSVPGKLGPIQTADPDCIAVAGGEYTRTPMTTIIPGTCMASATNVTGTLDEDKQAKETPPHSDSELSTYAAEDTASGYGCLYYGPTTITFDTDDQMTVWSPDTPGTSHCPSTGDTGNVPNGGHVTSGNGISTLGNGVIYVATEPNTADCKSNANPFEGKTTGGTGAKSQLDHYDHTSSTTPNCEADVFVSDANKSTTATSAKPTSLPGISGQLTIGSSANIVITGTVEYTHCGKTFNSSAAHTETSGLYKEACQYNPAGTKTPTNPTRTEPNDVLGLIANDYVEVSHPVTTTTGLHPTKVTTCGTTTRGKPEAAVCEPGAVTIDAAILALQHSFAVNNPSTSQDGSKSGSTGQLTIYGTIDQKWRGAVGTVYTGGFTAGKAATGYLKYYDWDSRVTAVPPPHYLNPSTPSWALGSSAISSQATPPMKPTPTHPTKEIPDPAP